MNDTNFKNKVNKPIGPIFRPCGAGTQTIKCTIQATATKFNMYNNLVKMAKGSLWGLRLLPYHTY